ncbi:hypothetical protein AVEN_55118-1, partial [Araneus ventricosus]
CNRPRPPPTCAESDGLLPAEGDCSSYYQSAEGHAYFVKCPDGSHFNAEYGVCEPPCDAGCDPTIGKKQSDSTPDGIREHLLLANSVTPLHSRRQRHIPMRMGAVLSKCLDF